MDSSDKDEAHAGKTAEELKKGDTTMHGNADNSEVLLSGASARKMNSVLEHNRSRRP